MKSKPSASGDLSTRAASGAVDPLEVVTDLDVRAESEGLGLCKGTLREGILRTNEEFLAVTGLSSAAVRGWDWLAAVHADDRDRVRRSIDAACTSGARSAFPVRMQVRLGVIESLRLIIGAVPGPSDEPVFVLVVVPPPPARGGATVVEPVSDAPPREAVDDGHDHEGEDVDPHRVLIDALTVPIAYAGPDGTVEFANPAWVAWTGVTVDGHLRDALPLDGAERIVPLQLAVGVGIAWSGRCPMGERDAEISVAPLAAHLGGGTVVTITEVHGRSDATAPDVDAGLSIAAQIELCERLASATPDYAAVLSVAGEVLALNAPARERLGLAPDADPRGAAVSELFRFTGSTPDAVSSVAMAALATDGSFMTAGELGFGVDSWCPVTLLLFALRDENGVHRATFCAARDESEMRAARERIGASEAWYRTLVQHSADVVAVVSDDLRATFVSPACRELLGYEPDELIGAANGRLILPEDGQRVGAALERARSEGSAVVEYRVVRKDEQIRDLVTNIENRLDDPIIHGFVLSSRDVTDVRRESRARARSEETLRTVMQSAPVAIFAVDGEGRVQLWNPACEALFGWSRDEVVGSEPPFMDNRQRERASDFARRFLEGEAVTTSADVTRRDGTLVAISLSCAPILTSDGTIRSVVAVAVDVTLQRQAAAELQRRSEADRFVASVSQLLVEATPETLSDRATEALDATVDHFGALRAALFVRPQAEPRYRTADEDFSVDHLDPTTSGAFMMSGPDGAARGGWVVAGPEGARGVLVLDWEPGTAVVNGQLDPLAVIGAALVAATERVDAERAVHARELRFRALAEHAKDLVVVIDAEWRLRYASPSAFRFFGMREYDAFDSSDSVVHPDDAPAVSPIMAEVLARGHGATSPEFIARFRGADGTYRRFELMITNLIDTVHVGGLVINGRDVTERFAMEQQLRHSERRFRGLVQNLVESVIVLAADGSVKYSSPSAAQMMGFSQDQGVGSLALDFVVEEDRERVAETLARAFSEPGVQGPMTLRIHGANDRIRCVEALGHNRLDDPDVEGVVVTARDITERVEAEEAARRSDARLSAIVENLSDVITIVDTSGSLLYTSPTAGRLFGFEPGDESYTDPTSRIHPDDLDAAMQAIAAQVAHGGTDPVRFRLKSADGRWCNVETVTRDMTGDPAVGGIVVTTRDVTDRTRAESLVVDQAEILRRIAGGGGLTDTLDAICAVLEHHVDDSLFGVMLADVDADSVRLVAGPRIPAELVEMTRDLTVEAAGAVCGTALSGTPSLTTFADVDGNSLIDGAIDAGVGQVWAVPIFDSAGHRVIGVLGAGLPAGAGPGARDREVVEMFAQTAAIAIERQGAEDLLAHRANHDSLTGLPNRVLFMEFLSLALARNERDGSTVAVLFLDLDRFKHINDGLGHDAGDELLRQLADRLRDEMRPSDVVARFGGDEFTVLCDGLDPEHAEAQAREIAERLLVAIESPVSLEGEDRRLSASLGIAIASPGRAPDDLLREADAAMYAAKQHGKARSELFDDEMRSTMHRRLDLEDRLERAIERDEFRLFVQPIIELATGRCVGGEGLLRWHDPELGMITPDAFIGLAEDTGLIIPMGEWALAEACRTVARWDQVGLLGADFTMSVNLSARQVGQTDLADKVSAVIDRSGATVSRLCLEITETVLMEEGSVEIMHALRDLGLSLSIDDFGTGYSSLGYLKRFPVDSVKVDRSFVDGLGTDGEDSAIVTAVVSLGHALGLSVVAEGVETSGQLRALMQLGCDRAQGYWFSGPRSASEFAGLLNQQPWVADRAEWPV